ncbi:unnamed protein product, partial [marine sediment metagenome]
FFLNILANFAIAVVLPTPFTPTIRNTVGGLDDIFNLLSPFLFSIYSINSSPFYVFDEVDATLDDVNISRFLTLVKKFSEKQQIIIITHQKRTMEVADTIYGVTMQSNGVSKIISEKIGKKYAEVN